MNTRGAAAEERACRHLQSQGLRLVERNANSRLGELDLIMQDRDELVIVEVRARAARSPLSAAESITPQKRQRILAATRQWLSRHPAHFEKPMRFDVVALDGDELQWIRNAFDAL